MNKKPIEITWTEDKALIKLIREEIWRLTQAAPDMDTVRWLVSLDNCFENDEFFFEEFGNLQWRLMVLSDKGQALNLLYRLIEDAIPVHRLARESDNNHEALLSNKAQGGGKSPAAQTDE